MGEKKKEADGTNGKGNTNLSFSQGMDANTTDKDTSSTEMGVRNEGQGACSCKGKKTRNTKKLLGIRSRKKTAKDYSRVGME